MIVAQGGPHMFRRTKTFVVSVLMIGAVGCLASAPTIVPQRPAKDRSKEALGFLEHRGKRYWLSDLFDPAYRAASDDRFVRQFDEGMKVAEGRKPEDRFSDNKSNTGELRPLPWAGRGPDRRADWDLWAGPDP